MANKDGWEIRGGEMEQWSVNENEADEKNSKIMPMITPSKVQ